MSFAEKILKYSPLLAVNDSEWRTCHLPQSSEHKFNNVIESVEQYLIGLQWTKIIHQV